MTRVGDGYAFPRILDKMEGKCNLDSPLESNIHIYMRNEFHENWFADDDSCFMCVSHHDGFISIPYTYRDNSYKALKELVDFAKELYKCYTIDKQIPIIYTGLKNFYPNHSVELAKDVWQLVIKG